ncbi:ISNCY family transposase, partial [Francisella philomiragia]|uniref:ISNCY family transposase n=1 Tax=Francisella philomiragia TaxID=28110 RepID=UPI0035167652
MSMKELDRLEVIKKCANKELSQTNGARHINITTRHLRRLIKGFRLNGIDSLISKHRGKHSNNKIPDTVRKQVLNLVYEKYYDFGPTLAHEYITEQYGYTFSVETLRKWMITDGIWKAKHKSCKIHQSRDRRSCYGELVQIDGSPHDWFEGRADKCNLLVFIDDATGKLMTCHFSNSETTESYMSALSNYLSSHGRPLAFYSDMHGVFKVNHKGKEHELTQFSRALEEFDIELIFAKTPQAKGRVERANKTLQDRLIKALRLANINTIDDANKFLPKFIDDYNNRFSVRPRSKENLHRPVKHSDNEKRAVLSIQATRRLTKNLTISFNSTEYQLIGYGKGYRLQNKTINVCKYFNGDIELYHDGKKMNYKCFSRGKAPKVVSRKELDTTMTNIKNNKGIKYKP